MTNPTPQTLHELRERVEALKTDKSPNQVVDDIRETYKKWHGDPVKESKNQIRGFWATRAHNNAIDKVLAILDSMEVKDAK